MKIYNTTVNLAEDYDHRFKTLSDHISQQKLELSILQNEHNELAK